MPSARNNRIMVADFLIDLARWTFVVNQYCSELPSKSFFNSIDPFETSAAISVTNKHGLG